jgi:hypothetical protein
MFDDTMFFGNKNVIPTLAEYLKDDIPVATGKKILKEIGADEVSEKHEEMADKIKENYGFYQGSYLGDCKGFGGTNVVASMYQFIVINRTSGGGKRGPKAKPKEPKAPKAPKKPKEPKAPKAPKPKSTLMKWVQALKIFNEKKDKWCIPRKGTPEYEEVQRIRRGETGPSLTIEEVKKPEPAIEHIKPGKEFDEDFKEYIDTILKGEGDPFNIDYTASSLITDYIFLFLMHKYKYECGVFVQKPGTSINYYTKDGKRIAEETKVFARGVNFAEPAVADLYKFQIGKRIEDCVAGGAKIVAIPFSIKGHANMMLYRPGNNTMEHYEPHGDKYYATGAKERNRVVEVFKSWLPDWETLGFIPEGSRFIPSNEICPNPKGLQAYEGQAKQANPKFKIGKGFCQMWSLFYLEMCLKYPTKSGTELNKKATDELNAMGLDNFAKHIVMYTKGLSKEVNKMLNVDANITTKSFKKNEDARNELRTAFNKMVDAYLQRDKPLKVQTDAKQVARLKQKRAELMQDVQKLAGEVNSSKGNKKKEAEKQLKRTEKLVIDLNRVIAQIENEMAGSGRRRLWSQGPTATNLWSLEMDLGPKEGLWILEEV